MSLKEGYTLISSFMASSFIGKLRARLPVSWNKAFEMAGPTAGNPNSPTEDGRSAP